MGGRGAVKVRPWYGIWWGWNLSQIVLTVLVHRSRSQRCSPCHTNFKSLPTPFYDIKPSGAGFSTSVDFDWRFHGGFFFFLLTDWVFLRRGCNDLGYIPQRRPGLRAPVLHSVAAQTKSQHSKGNKRLQRKQKKQKKAKEKENIRGECTVVQILLPSSISISSSGNTYQL